MLLSSPVKPFLRLLNPAVTSLRILNAAIAAKLGDFGGEFGVYL